MAWRPATVADTVVETATARTLLLDVPGWPGHRAGQHVDLQLRAEDGYTARRSYSLAAPDDGSGRIALTVQRIADGEVSPYLCDVVEPGDVLEVRGPVGGWFVWPRPGADGRPTVLFGGGSGVVPLMAMVRARDRADPGVPMRLVYSVRSPADVLYAAELAERRAAGLPVDLVYTRRAPVGQPVGRLDARAVRAASPVGQWPLLYVCGPTGFVEAVARALLDAGHEEAVIRTERFGPSGG
jgi:ferredoxin-NADP reductase